MDSLGILAMGFGAFLMFQAVRNKQPTPIKHARDLLKRAAIPPSSTRPAPTTTTTVRLRRNLATLVPSCNLMSSFAFILRTSQGGSPAVASDAVDVLDVSALFLCFAIVICLSVRDVIVY